MCALRQWPCGCDEDQMPRGALAGGRCRQELERPSVSVRDWDQKRGQVREWHGLCTRASVWLSLFGRVAAQARSEHARYPG